MTPQNNKARTNIILHCGNQQTAWIHLLKTSKEIWDKLKVTYECCNKVLKLLCLKKISPFNNEWWWNCSKKFGRFLRFIGQGSSSWFNLQWPRSHIVTSYPINSWCTFVMTQGSVPNLSLTNLITNILQEGSMTKYSPNNNTQTSTFYIRIFIFFKGQLNWPFQITNCLNMAIPSSEPIPNYPSHGTQL